MKNNLKFALALAMTMAVGTVQPGVDLNSVSKMASVVGNIAIKAALAKPQLVSVLDQTNQAIKDSLDAQKSIKLESDPLSKTGIAIKAVKDALVPLEATAEFLENYSGITGSLMSAGADLNDTFKKATILPSGTAMYDAVGELYINLETIFKNLSALITALENAAAEEAAKPCLKPTAPVKPTTTTTTATKPVTKPTTTPAKTTSTAGMTPAQKRAAAAAGK